MCIRDRIFFVNVIGKAYIDKTDEQKDCEMYALQYSPDGKSIVTAGIHLGTSLGNPMWTPHDMDPYDGFICMFSSSRQYLWKHDAESTGKSLPSIDIVAFSPLNTQVACTGPDKWLYIVEVSSQVLWTPGYIVDVEQVAFDLSGKRIVIVHRSRISIIDSTSGAKLHETQLFDRSLKIEAISWPKDDSEDD